MGGSKMDRMSARFVAMKMCRETSWVYKIWEEMGLVVKDNFGDWVLTDKGKEEGGRTSRNGGVPTFEFDVIEKMMTDFCSNK